MNTIILVGDAMARPLVDALDEREPTDMSSLMVISSAGAILSDAREGGAAGAAAPTR